MKYFFLVFLLILLGFNSTLVASNAELMQASQIFKKCAKCHGKDGKNLAFGTSDEIAGQEVEELIDSMNFFKNSKFGKRGVINVMAKQVKNLSDQQIQELAKYISNLGQKK